MLLLPLIFLFVGILVLLIVQFFIYRKVRRMQNWNSTSGKILTSALAREPLDRTPLWHPSIKYSYKVEGKTYRNTKIRIGNRYTDLPTAQKEIEQYSVGGEVTVFYDPQNPENSVLVRDSRGINYVLLIVTLVLSLMFSLIFSIQLLEIYYQKS